jgi:hypothetical protein
VQRIDCVKSRKPETQQQQQQQQQVLIIYKVLIVHIILEIFVLMPSQKRTLVSGASANVVKEAMFSKRTVVKTKKQYSL